MLTCAGSASRNARLGHAIGQGTAPAEARQAIGAAVEGVDAAPALLARAGGVSCPIIAGVAAVLAGQADVASAMAALLDRPGADE
jgi:glycerol-3-phosphate dehydrogenase (NAD(P)+)